MKKYYYLNRSNQQCGPVDESELKNYDVTPETLVWAEGMAGWQKAVTVVPGCYLAGVAVPPPPPGVVPPAPVAGTTVADGCPDNYLVWSILATVLCCLPTGVAAIVYSSKVESLWRDGRHEEARKSAANAKMWCLISVGAAIVGSLIWGVFVLIASL